MKATAPGKLFLIGEYAVLEGGPAILTTVPQRAEASLAPTDTAMVTTITSETQQIPLHEALTDLPLVSLVLNKLNCREQLQQHTLTLDTSAFYKKGVKLGLGSSAAVTAALVKLLLPGADQPRQFDIANHCHQNFQSGKGSGADIALSVNDIPITFRMGHPPESISLPTDLYMLAIWTGQAASTTAFISGLQRWQGSHEKRYLHHMHQLIETAEQCVNAIKTDQTRQVLAIIEQYGGHLESLSSESGLDFYNPSHLTLRKQVELMHCVYKPSGAGGGDFGIAYSANKNDLIILAEKMAREGRYAFFL